MKLPEMNRTEKANFNGVTFTDIDKGAEWSFRDYNCDRIPIKGDVMHFRHFVGNDSTLYYGEVLFVIDYRQMWGQPKMQDCEIKTYSITVVMKEIKGEWGDKTYGTISRALANGR